ncbi:MAG: ATP synthase F1 subunit gamma [Bacteroidetes bacterium]|nr:ATP synthase F1 subunit gamma [Bacteroidota bacterium]
MPNLKEVKTRISSVVSTQQITKAMKMVAVSKLRRAKNSILQMRPFAEKLNEILINVSKDLDADEGKGYGTEREIEKVLIVVITSDRGLCGPFNGNVSKRTVALIEENYKYQFDTGDVHILSLGKKGFDFFRRRKYHVIAKFTDIFRGLSFKKGREPAEFVMNAFLQGEYDKVDIVYNEFKNVARQVVRVEQFLPIAPDSDTEQLPGIIDYIFQPDKKVIIEEMIPKSLKIQFYKAMLESNAAEHGARMTAMEQATENAGELLGELRLVYNRTRQAAITKEILEIVAGAEALS